MTRPRRAAAVTSGGGGRSPGRRAPPAPAASAPAPAPAAPGSGSGSAASGPAAPGSAPAAPRPAPAVPRPARSWDRPPTSHPAFSGRRPEVEFQPHTSGGEKQKTRASGVPSQSARASSAVRDPSAVSPYASPVLVLVAAVAILEGYRWLNVLPPLGWRPVTALLTVVAVPLAVAVTRGDRRGRGGRRVVAGTVTGVALLLVPATITALVLPRSPAAQLVGAMNLLLAVTALAAVLVNERSIGSNRRVPRASESAAASDQPHQDPEDEAVALRPETGSSRLTNPDRARRSAGEWLRGQFRTASTPGSHRSHR